MKSLAIALVFLLSACSTTVPVTAKFPQAPGTLVQVVPAPGGGDQLVAYMKRVIA